MYFGAKYIEPEVTSYNPNYEENFYNEFYNIFWAANNELDFGDRIYSLMEAENELVVSNTGNKSDSSPDSGSSKEKSGSPANLADRITGMINAVIKWIKDAFAAVIKAVQDAYDKVKNNTLRDEMMQKLFKNFSYDKIEEARNLGWGGISKNILIPASLDIKQSSIVYERFNKYYGDEFKDIDDLIEKMYLDQTYDNCRECYDEVMEKVNNLKSKVTLKHDDMEPLVRVYSAQASQYGSDPKSSVYVPLKNHFEGLEDLVFHSQQKIIDLRKSFEANFKRICDTTIKDDKNELKNLRRDKSDSEGRASMTLYLKAKLASASYKLSLAKEILKDGIASIKQSFILAVLTYYKIFSKCTNFLKKAKSGKIKVEKEPEEEPVAASFIDYDMDLDFILDM